MWLMVKLKNVYDELIKKTDTIETTDTSNVVKNTDRNIKISENINKILDHDHDKYIIQKFSKLIREDFAAKPKDAKLATKNDIIDLIKKAKCWW